MPGSRGIIISVGTVLTVYGIETEQDKFAVEKLDLKRWNSAYRLRY